MAKELTDEQHANSIIRCVKELNAALDAFHAAATKCHKAGLRVNFGYESSIDVDKWGSHRFSASIERHTFIAGIQG